jgi:hypothetical protein
MLELLWASDGPSHPHLLSGVSVHCLGPSIAACWCVQRVTDVFRSQVSGTTADNETKVPLLHWGPV